LKQLGYDERILGWFKIDPESGHLYVDLTKHQMDREDVLSELLNLFRIRYVSLERIYYHHAKVASGRCSRGRSSSASGAGSTRRPSIRSPTPSSRSCSGSSRGGAATRASPPCPASSTASPRGSF
jgi:hypothetical protein